MKNFILLIIFSSVFFACKSAEIVPQKIIRKQENKVTDNLQIVQKISIIPNQTLSVEKNEMGQKYIKTLPGEHIVIKISYIQTPKDTSLKDARYSEYVWFEIKDNVLKNNNFNSSFFQKNPLYVQVYGNRKAKLIPVTRATLNIKIPDKHTAVFTININDNNPLIRQKNIKQIIKF